MEFVNVAPAFSRLIASLALPLAYAAPAVSPFCRHRRPCSAVILFSCALALLTAAKPAHAQGSVSGVTVPPSVSSLTVKVGTPATFTATASPGTPHPDQYWTVISGPTYAWQDYEVETPYNAATTTLSKTYNAPGTYTMRMACQVFYGVQSTRGGTASISMTASAPQDVTIYVIGGPISGTNDISYFCTSNDTSTFGNLSAAGGQPTGTTYSWSLSGSAIYCDSSGNSTSPTGTSVVYRGVSPGSTSMGDVKATVTYSFNGVSAASPQYPITVHVPVHFIVKGQDAPVAITSGPNAYGFDGQRLRFQITDGLNMPITNVYWDEIWNVTGNGNGPSPPHIGGSLDGMGNSVDNFWSYGNPPPTDPAGENVIGPSRIAITSLMTAEGIQVEESVVLCKCIRT